MSARPPAHVLPSEQDQPQIRVGIMANGRTFPKWQAEVIRTLRATPGVEIALLIVRQRESRGPALLAKLKDWKYLVWTLYNKGYVERRSRALQAVDLSVELAAVPEITCGTEPAGKFGVRFADTDVGTIRSHDLDVILRFSFGIIKGAILHAARYGVWSFHHGDEREFRGRPPAFWELANGKPVIGSMLQRLTERLDGGVVLHRGFFRATAHSYLRTLDDALLGSAVWPSIAIRQIQCGDTSLVEGAPSSTNALVRHNPRNAAMVYFLLRQTMKFVLAQLRGLTRSAKWTIGVVDAPIAAFLDGSPEIRWAPEQGPSQYLADPFGVYHGGRLIALAEHYDYETHRGVISAVDVDGDGTAHTVLDPGVHASYPYVLEADGEIYCIPETYQAGEVRLYRAVDFPGRWEHVATLVEGMAALDATVVRHDERWWLFCTDYADGPNTKLHVFHADKLSGPWSAHALNPVKTDIRSSRPAGTPFIHGGRLYRPAQDGSLSYGSGIVITRIESLTPTAFSEAVVARVAPPDSGRYRDGIHTLAAAGDRTLVDGRRDTFIAAAFRRELTFRLKKLTWARGGTLLRDRRTSSAGIRVDNSV